MLTLWLVLLLGFAGCAVGEQACMSTDVIQQEMKKAMDKVLTSVPGILCAPIPNVSTFGLIGSLSSLSNLHVTNASVNSVNVNNSTLGLSATIDVELSCKEMSPLKVSLTVHAGIGIGVLGNHLKITINKHVNIHVNIGLLGNLLVSNLVNSLTQTLTNCLLTPINNLLQAAVNAINIKWEALGSINQGHPVMINLVSVNRMNGALILEYKISNLTGQTLNSSSSSGLAPLTLNSTDLLKLSMIQSSVSNLLNMKKINCNAMIPSKVIIGQLTKGSRLGDMIHLNIQTSAPVSCSITDGGIAANLTLKITLGTPSDTVLVIAEVNSTAKINPVIKGAVLSLNMINLSLSSAVKLTFTHRNCTCHNMIEILNLLIGSVLPNIAAQQSCNGNNILALPLVSLVQGMSRSVEIVYFGNGVVILTFSKSPSACPACTVW